MNNHETVDVITGARLHFGLLCGTAETGWQFGGVGLMVNNPGWHIRLRSNPSDSSAVPLQAASRQAKALPATTVPESIPADAVTRDEVAQKVQEILSHLQPHLKAPVDSKAIQILQTCPAHAGFGAGTQLALAIASAIKVQQDARPSGGTPLSSGLSQLAGILGRASRSAIGTEGFARGGFLVDHGLPQAGQSVRRIQRLDVPDSWRFLLVRPGDSTGLSGSSEKEYFDRRCTMPTELVTELVNLIEEQLVPALQQASFHRFAESLGTYGQLTGQFYSPAQGDVFSSPRMSALAKWLASRKISGAAQSSWGPGICIPTASAADATQLVRDITAYLNDPNVSLIVTSARNYGATIRTSAPESGYRTFG